jgi:hypothetical protein
MSTQRIWIVGVAVILCLGFVAAFLLSGREAVKQLPSVSIRSFDESTLSQMTVVDWKATLNEQNYPCLAFTEEDFLKLSISEQSAMQQDAIELLNMLKPSVIWYGKEAKNLREQNPKMSLQYLESARFISDTMNDPRRLAILQSSGKFYKAILDNPQ